MRYQTYFLTLVTAILCCIYFPGQGQILNKLKKAATDGVEKAVEKRVTREIQNAAARQTDRYMNQIFGPPSDYEGTDYDYGQMMGSMNVDTEDSYSFTGYTDMLITGTNEKGKKIDPTSFRSFLSSVDEFWAIEMENQEKDLENAIMIFDNKNKATIMLMTDKKGEKSRIAYSLDWGRMMEASMDEQMTSEDSTLNFTRTGNSKTILGHTCDEYMTETSGYTTRIWVTQEPVEGYASYWSKNNYLFSRQMKEKYNKQLDNLPDGNVLEINYVSKEDKSETNMLVTEINTDREFTFVLDEYTNIMESSEE